MRVKMKLFHLNEKKKKIEKRLRCIALMTYTDDVSADLEPRTDRRPPHLN